MSMLSPNSLHGSALDQTPIVLTSNPKLSKTAGLVAAFSTLLSGCGAAGLFRSPDPKSMERLEPLWQSTEGGTKMNKKPDGKMELCGKKNIGEHPEDVVDVLREMATTAMAETCESGRAVTTGFMLYEKAYDSNMVDPRVCAVYTVDTVVCR